MNEQKQKRIVVLNPAKDYDLEGFVGRLERNTQYKVNGYSVIEKALEEISDESIKLFITNHGQKGNANDPEHGKETVEKARKQGYNGLILMLTNSPSVTSIDEYLIDFESLRMTKGFSRALASAQFYLHQELAFQGLIELIEKGHSPIFEPLYGKRDWKDLMSKQLQH